MTCDDWREACEQAGPGAGDGPDGHSPLPRLKYLGYLLNQLPPVIARKRILRIFGGAVSVGTLANADSAGKGPRGRFYVGRDCVYPTIYLLEWMEKKGIRPQVSSEWRADD